MPKAQRPARDPERTRRRLLQSAIRLFSARGLHGVSVDQIVAAARVNKRMVYHYFGSKEAIYQASLAEVYGRLEGVEFHAVEREGSAAQKLTRLLESYFAFLDDNREFVQLLQWENLEQGRHLPSDHRILSKNPFLERFRAIVDEGVQAGQFRSDLDVRHLLIHFIGLCFIYFSNRYSLSKALAMDLGAAEVKAEGCRQVLALVLDGIRRR
jgi:AcrR family transcriptional regulator